MLHWLSRVSIFLVVLPVPKLPPTFQYKLYVLYLICRRRLKMAATLYLKKISQAKMPCSVINVTQVYQEMKCNCISHPKFALRNATGNFMIE